MGGEIGNRPLGPGALALILAPSPAAAPVLPHFPRPAPLSAPTPALPYARDRQSIRSSPASEEIRTVGHIGQSPIFIQHAAFSTNEGNAKTKTETPGTGGKSRNVDS